KSSGTTLSAEKYSLPTSVTTRFVRVTVNGNTENNWASITELSVDGSSSTPNTNCIKLPFSGVAASGTGDADDHNGPDHDADDGNVPANVLDNNLGTRWSNLGVGSFIQADLGGQKTICSVDIAWYRGNPRVNSFVISVSSDGTSFTNVFTGKSSGTTLSAEKYSLPTSVTTRFVRVTVNGNTENNWASITELSVDGFSNNNLPTADNKSVNTNLGTPVSIILTGTDPIPGDTLKFSVVANPTHGTLTNPTSNSVTYTPTAGFSGTDTFTYKSTDGQGVSSNIATVTITVNAAQNNPPTADNKTLSTNAGTPVQITLTGTDPIPGDTLKFSVVANPTHGTLTNPTSNSVTYTPTAGFSGTDTFTYKSTDGQGVSSNIATVTITVNAPPPPPPTANNINIQTNKETPIGITLTGTDPIPGDTLKFSIVGSPTHGTVAPGTVSSNVFYTPNTGFIGTDSFTYKATDGRGVDSNIATVTIIVSNATSGTLDQFGIKELNPSKPGGEQWFFNGATGNPNNDPRTGTPNEGPHTTFTGKNPDGSWKVQSSEVRYGILTSTFFQENQIKTLNQQQMAAQGYMLRPNDWKNVELTAYLRVVSASSSTSNGASHIEFGAHGARNTHGGTVGGFDSSCEATAYHSNTYLTGRVKFEKDLQHTNGYSVESADPQKLNQVNTTEFKGGNWIGIKMVTYDIGNGSVKVEQWVDDHSNNIQPGNHWRKVLETIDHGQWGPTRGGNHCGGSEFQVASWGGPIALFRWDNIPNMDIKDASVREIIPPT
ncbi:MAG TPA: Ig-like domain-containing protein, partial [Candidatus Nitrosopolaris sp.]|nr:Ig-like domain-containing protein [Candidatus Nitrosopolaris sp.]